MKGPFYSPRPLDRETRVPLGLDDDLSALDEAKIFAAPDDPEQWPAWREQLHRWRTKARARLDYHGDRYRSLRPPCFSLAMANLWDARLYDHESGTFTVEGYVRAAEQEFGGFDGVLLWHAYPVVGIDPRRQLAFFRDLPDLPEVVAAFQRQGVQVFMSYYPWASGADAHSSTEVVECVRWLGVDGVFLDSVKEGSQELRSALDSVSVDLLMGGESRVPLARIEDHQMSWAQWFADSPVPGVLRAKWFERRHVIHHTRRWHRSHLEELHSAWLNGSGILVWENVFGVWVGWSERDKATLRGMRTVHRDWAAWLTSERWTPLADHPGYGCDVYASRWEHAAVPLWTLVNKGEETNGPWLVTEERPGHRFVEITRGRDLTIAAAGPGRVSIGGRLPAGGIAAVVALPEETARPQRERLAADVEPAERDSTFPGRVAVRVRPAPALASSVPPEMVRLEGGRIQLEVHYRQRETALYGEVPFIDEWKPTLGSRLHYTATTRRVVHLHACALDVYEVTNAQFADFLAATGYQPARAERFLAHWPDEELASDVLQKPVTNVDLADARAYAKWRNARLPTEDEWQHAVQQGKIGRLSPLVWNLTESEHDDGRTRFVILKGGCAFDNSRSEWYFDGGAHPASFSAKLLRLAGGLTRSPWVGFRCAVDLA